MTTTQERDKYQTDRFGFADNGTTQVIGKNSNLIAHGR
jgi:hypothetical protein